MGHENIPSQIKKPEEFNAISEIPETIRKGMNFISEMVPDLPGRYRQSHNKQEK